MKFCTTNFTNCSSQQLLQPEATTLASQVHHHIQTVVLTLMLIYILLLNGTAIAVTIGSARLRGCLFSMQLAASYVGDILGASSLIGNDIYSSQRGVLPLCQKGSEAFVLLYFGVALSMMVLLMNTHFRYKHISSVSKCDQDDVRTRDVVLKNWLPGLFASAGICAVAVAIQNHYSGYHHFLISMGICVVPLAVAIAWNLVLGRRLTVARASSVYVQNVESLVVLDRATFIINSVITLHLVFLVACVGTSVATLYVHQYDVAMGISWLLRALYFLLFTIQGHVYLFTVKMARDIIVTKALQCFRWRDRIAADQVRRRNSTPL